MIRHNAVRLAIHSLALAGVAFTLAGCGDAIVGRWEAKEDNTVDLEVTAANTGYYGSGHLYLSDGTQSFLCPFDFTMTDNGSSAYELSGHFTNNCASAGSFDNVSCTLRTDTLLKCELPGGTTIEYEHQDL